MAARRIVLPAAVCLFVYLYHNLVNVGRVRFDRHTAKSTDSVFARADAF